MGYRHHKTLPIPAQVSCLSCVEPRQLLVGSGTTTQFNSLHHVLRVGCTDDGSVCLYGLDTFKVLKAIRGLGPISSVAMDSQTAATHIWVASGRQVRQMTIVVFLLFMVVTRGASVFPEDGQTYLDVFGCLADAGHRCG